MVADGWYLLTWDQVSIFPESCDRCVAFQFDWQQCCRDTRWKQKRLLPLPRQTHSFEYKGITAGLEIKSSDSRGDILHRNSQRMVYYYLLTWLVQEPLIKDYYLCIIPCSDIRWQLFQWNSMTTRKTWINENKQDIYFHMRDWWRWGNTIMWIMVVNF